MTETTVDDSQLSQSSLLSQLSGQTTRAGARVRETPAPVVVEPVTQATWVRPCTMYDDHRFSHRWTVLGWICDACFPDPAA